MTHLRERRAKIVKVSRKTFERKVRILKKRVETKKITQKRYQRIIYQYRSHMTISL